MLDFQVSTIVFTVINLLVLYFILRKLLVGRVNAVLEQRAARVKETIDSAEASKSQAEELRAEYEDKLTDARQEAAKLVADAQNRAQRAYEAKMADAETDAKRMRSEAEAQIASERDAMLRGARNEVASLALLAAAGIYFVTLKMRRGQPILTAWVTLPGFAGCLWIMSNYYESWAANPVLGQYLIPMLGALLSMLACFFMGGFAFEKGRVTVTLTLALAGGALNLMSLADGLPLADTALYLGMTFYLLASASALADSDARPEAAPTCSAHCETCAGCAPMGTLPPKEEKKKKSGGAAS